MKKGWTYKKLGEVGTFSRGINFTKKDYVIDGYPCIHYGQIHTTFGPVTNKHLTCISKDIVKTEKLASKGDLIIAITSEDVEASCKCTAWMGDYDVAVGAHAAIFKHQLNPAFVSYFFRSPIFQEEKKQFVHGFKVMEIKPSDIAKITIAFPSDKEQQRIVSRLDSAFANIDALKANAEKQLTEARALFQKALAKAMEPKKGWEVKTLKNVVDDKCPISYGIVQQGDHVEGGIPVVRPVDLNTKIVFKKGLKCTKESISNSYKRTILRGDEILLSVRGTTGILALASSELVGCNVNRGIVPLFFKKELDKDFAYYEMLSPNLQKVFAEKTTGSTLKQVNIKDLRLIKLFYPSLDTQQKIVSRLDSLSENIKKLEEVMRKTMAECDALKQAMLRKVFE